MTKNPVDKIEASLYTPSASGSDTNRPFVTLAYAQTNDGYLSPPSRKPLKISSTSSLILTHAIRSCHDSILVGIGTVLADNPRLTSRLSTFLSASLGKVSNFEKSVETENQPQPVILDAHFRIPSSSYLFNQGHPWVFVASSLFENHPHLKNLQDKITQLELNGGKVFKAPTLPVENETKSLRLDLQSVLSTLLYNGIDSVMVEGGPTVLSSFLETSFVDRLVITTGPLILGDGVRIQTNTPIFKKLQVASYHIIDGDIVTITK